MFNILKILKDLKNVYYNIKNENDKRFQDFVSKYVSCGTDGI